MGCGSSAAFSSGRITAITIEKKDAGSQTSVTVLIASAPHTRNEAHDARQESATRHRAEALARAQQLSNAKSGYTTATYTGSGMTTPRSAYSRTRKLRGSDAGSLSSHSGNLSRTELSTRSSSARKTQVSFRNEEYMRIAAASHSPKVCKSYLNRSKSRSSILRKDNRVSSIDCNRSVSSGENSTTKQGDTGYDGSISSGPSSTVLIKVNGPSPESSSGRTEMCTADTLSPVQNGDVPGDSSGKVDNVSNKVCEHNEHSTIQSSSDSAEDSQENLNSSQSGSPFRPGQTKMRDADMLSTVQSGDESISISSNDITNHDSINPDHEHNKTTSTSPSNSPEDSNPNEENQNNLKSEIEVRLVQSIAESAVIEKVSSINTMDSAYGDDLTAVG